jgi:electron transport complex protein RnfA
LFTSLRVDVIGGYARSSSLDKGVGKMIDVLAVLIGAAVINNLVIDLAVGSDSVLASMRRYDVALGLSRVMLVLLPTVTSVNYVMMELVPAQIQFQYLHTFVATLLIISVIYGLRAWAMIGTQGTPRHPLKADIEIFLPIGGINTMAIGTLILSQQQGHGFLHALSFGLGAAGGFSIILITLAFIEKRLQTADVPEPFRGQPILLITLGLLSMAFFGFTGLVR